MWDYLYSYYYQLVSIVFLISVDFGGKGSYRGLLVIEFPGWAITMVGNYFPKLESAPSLPKTISFTSSLPWILRYKFWTFKGEI